VHRSKGTKVQGSTIRPELMAEGKTYALTTYALVTSKLALFCIFSFCLLSPVFCILLLKLALFSCPGEVADEAGLPYSLAIKELTPNPILSLSKDWVCFFK